MLQLYNSLTRSIELFKPRIDKTVKMYTCGPSIYQQPHIGNYRTFLFEDILQRYLEYSGYRVERALNLTDVEDKSITQAEKQGTTLENLTEKYARQFIEEAKLLKIKSPNYLPRSSDTVDQAVRLIESLLRKKVAYWHKGNIYFDPLKFKDFGRLSRLDMSTWPRQKRRFHKDTYLGNRWNKGDFILWHGYKEGDKVYWETSLGKGRPAWNVQDPAMATKHLGFAIDIFCGGIDNLIRHHDYIIAVTESVSSIKLANFWLHGAHLYLNGKKMSKSTGNVLYLKDLLSQGFKPEHVRYFLIYGYYRKGLNFTKEKFRKKAEELDMLKGMVKTICSQTKKSQHKSPSKIDLRKLSDALTANLDNDLNVKGALISIQKTVSKLARMSIKGNLSFDEAKEACMKLKAIDEVLQIIF